MKTDIQIAQEAKPEEIAVIAAKLGIPSEAVFNYGRYKAKIDCGIYKELRDKKDAKLILVTAISPTPAGEGKTTTTVGLGDALTGLGHNALICLREPALGPVFGVKGGAAGGGYSQVIPMEDINLHFTGDFHAIGAANNLLAALIDNHIYQGNALNIDPRRVTWRRVLDMNDRQLRSVVSGLNGKANGVPREDGFDITVASEVMAIFCLSESLKDLKSKLSRMVVAYTYDNKPVLATDLNAEGAMTALLKDAFNPNLVQTLEHTPAFVHGGPFANIAHGCNSLMATRLAMKLGDYVVTEAGFGADLGAEKFIDIKCRKSGLKPDAVVLVATIRALKYHGGAAKTELGKPDISLLEKGAANLKRHISNIKNVYGLPLAVAINKFPSDTQEEIETVIRICKEYGADAFLSDVYASGGRGGTELAEKIVELTGCADGNKNFSFVYNESDTIKKKITAVAQKVYGAAEISLSPEAAKSIRELEKNGYGSLPVCIAKTQYSFSDNPKLLGAPNGFTLNVRQIKLSAGAGFIVAITGDIMTMPGLPKEPAAEKIDVDDAGMISGLF